MKPQLVMNSLTKSLAAATVAGLTAGSAFAGPSDAHRDFLQERAIQQGSETSGTVQIALFRGHGRPEAKPGVRPASKQAPTNPKLNYAWSAK